MDHALPAEHTRILSETFHRVATFDRAAVDTEKREIELSFSSEAPVERFFGIEILDHGKDAVRLDRLNSAGPLLFNHDRNAHVGRVVRAWVAGKKGRARVRFSNSQLGEEKFRDARDGILTEVSVGYRINEIVLEKGGEDSADTYRATSWEPFEISLVTVPADASVGIGRAAVQDQQGAQIITSESRHMNTDTTAAPKEQADILSGAAVLAQRHSNHAAAINAAALQFCREGRSAAEFNKHILERVLSNHASAPALSTASADGSFAPTMSGRDLAGYSLMRAIRHLADGRPLDGLEAEASQEEARQLGRRASGFFVPAAVLFASRHRSHRRGFSAGAPDDGGYTVGTDVLGAEMVGVLRNQSRIVELGARTLAGLVGDVSIPRVVSGGAVFWVGEQGSITRSNAKFGQIVAKPRRLGGSSQYTKQFLAQTSLSGEDFIREDLTAAMAVELDRVGINGAGGAEPLGVLNLATAERATSVTFGAAATYAKVNEFEANVGTANAIMGSPAFLTTPLVKSKWKSAQRFTNGGPGIWNGDEDVAGSRGRTTNQFPSSPTANQVIFGDFSQLLFLEWAGLDVVVDPYTDARDGRVNVTIQRLVDMIIRQGKAFAISTDSGAQ